ncbi:hypothetical protein HSX11_09375 [Oxalobacteraceae bacterium]|nr:hypothetical protein [Oxalobacteraceae bacterium]
MLAQDFIDWWFAPWDYASAAAPLPAMDRLGLRDGYRVWCGRAGIAAALPAHFDPAWQAMAAIRGDALLAGARLFGGLIAARAQRHDTLAELGIAERKWCVGVAATQPLHGWPGLQFRAADTIELRGLSELACWLEADFPGLWPRLQLTLPRATAARIEGLLAGAAAAAPEPSALRAQRCWNLCLRRAAGSYATFDWS